MTRLIHCSKLNKECAGLERIPYPGDLGKKIFDHISEEAWKSWLGHQTMLINENRLSMLDPNARAFLAAEMEKFLFGEGSTPPEGFIPPEEK